MLNKIGCKPGIVGVISTNLWAIHTHTCDVVIHSWHADDVHSGRRPGNFVFPQLYRKQNFSNKMSPTHGGGWWDSFTQYMIPLLTSVVLELTTCNEFSGISKDEGDRIFRQWLNDSANTYE